MNVTSTLKRQVHFNAPAGVLGVSGGVVIINPGENELRDDQSMFLLGLDVFEYHVNAGEFIVSGNGTGEVLPELTENNVSEEKVFTPRPEFPPLIQEVDGLRVKPRGRPKRK